MGKVLDKFHRWQKKEPLNKQLSDAFKETAGRDIVKKSRKS